MKVLIVDDSSIVRQKLKLTVGKYYQNATIYTADNGQEAMNLLNESHIDLMFLDWNMPIMDGASVVENVRKNPKWNKLKIIMATAESNKKKALSIILTSTYSSPSQTKKYIKFDFAKNPLKTLD